jgi:hypothetical protein
LTAAEALQQAREAGAKVTITGDNQLRAPASVVELLRPFKAEIIELLRVEAAFQAHAVTFCPVCGRWAPHGRHITRRFHWNRMEENDPDCPAEGLGRRAAIAMRDRLRKPPRSDAERNELIESSQDLLQASAAARPARYSDDEWLQAIGAAGRLGCGPFFDRPKKE